MKIQVTNNDWKIKSIKIKDKTKNKYGLPTFLAMTRQLNK